MKKTILTFSFIAIFLINACSIFGRLGFRTISGSGQVLTERRQVASFDRVDVCCGMHLYLTQDGTETLQIKADDNILTEIETRVVNGKLEITYRETSNVSYRPTQPVQITLSVENLQEVTLSGGGRLQSESIRSNRLEIELSGGSITEINQLDVDQFRVQISGGGEIRADVIETQDLDMELSGASDAWIEDLTAETLRFKNSGGGVTTIAGSVDEAEVEMSGGGDFKAEDLQMGGLVISCSGGSDATVWVENQLEADLSGGSSLAYYGQPEIIDQDLSGGSSLDSLGSR